MDIKELIDNGHKDRKYTKEEGLIIFKKILEHKNTLYKAYR